ncbi:MAG: flagellar export protein FliJ [Woeseiaceae bacterium]|nr:flagellar export protein FliJ [Woeseiaceae bacterium]
MKKRSQRLQKIVALAEAEERNLGILTGRSQGLLNEEKTRLGELNAYRQSYAQKAGFSTELSSAHLKDYQRFLARLDQAVRAQQQVVLNCEQSAEMHRRRWMVKRQRVDSLERVQERYHKQEQQDAERAEQRELDDLPNAPEIYSEDP